MKKIIICVLILAAISAVIYSCAGGYAPSYSYGFRGASGPYGGYGDYPNVKGGSYGGGYPRYGY